MASQIIGHSTVFFVYFFFKFFFQHVVQANIKVSNHLPFLRGIYHWEVHSPYKRPVMPKAFQALNWRHNDHDGVSNHQPHGYLLNRLFRRRSKETSKLRVTGLCLGNSPGPVNSPHKGPVCFHLMTSSWYPSYTTSHYGIGWVSRCWLLSKSWILPWYLPKWTRVAWSWVELFTINHYSQYSSRFCPGKIIYN